MRMVDGMGSLKRSLIRRSAVSVVALLTLPWVLHLPPWVVHPRAAQRQGAARVMLATVFDRNSRPTVDVDPDDFVIEEGNDEREVLSVQVADYPVTLVIDNGEGEVGQPSAAATTAVPGQTETLHAIRQAAIKFIQRIGQRPVAVATLTDPPSFVATFDDERAAVLKAVEGIVSSPRAPLRPLAALTRAAALINELASPFSVVVVISAGAVDPLEQPEADRIAPIVESGATVHVIALRPPGSVVPESAPDLYRTIADQTRGQFIPIFTTVSYGIALDRLADQLSSEIMIDYLVPPGTSGENARVGIRIPGARVRGVRVSK